MALTTCNAWLFTGDNALNPESDALEYAHAERRLCTFKSPTQSEERVRKRLATYRTAVRSKARSSRLYGAMGDEAKGRAQIGANLGKVDLAFQQAKTLCRTAGEGSVLFNFVASEALAPTS